MFGHSDDNQQQAAAPVGAPVVASDSTQYGGATDTNSYGLGEIPASNEVPTQEGTAPSSDFYSPPAPAADPVVMAAPTTPFSSPAPTPTSDDVDLADIKQKALHELSPLVSHLEQNPLEKFKTTMMMIQAADDKSLIPEAYNAAQAIPDEKAKAQALLDIVNEINYFTQQSASN